MTTPDPDEASRDPRDAPVSRSFARGVSLEALAHDVEGLRVPADARGVVVTGATQDSRRVAPGDLFIARKGASADGERFIDAAVARGARAVLVAAGSAARVTGAARLEADDLESALAFASAAVYGHPTFSLDVIGLTGTNGKTTTAHLIAACFAASGARPGIVGTLGYEFEGSHAKSTHTSPEADELARVAAGLLARGATHLVMEVSSIALAAKRVEAVRFRAAVLTNFTQDHLDYHGSMEAYAAAKTRLFTDLAPGASVLNGDDPLGDRLAARLGAGRDPNVWRYGTSDRARAEFEIAPVALALSASGIAMRARTPRGELELRSPLVGKHNVENLLAAIAAASTHDVALDAIARALSAPTSVPGRLEVVSDPARDDVTVVVDYAHTPDALERVLASLRAVTAGPLVCVFGCGGDRDPGKRPLMGQAVLRGADVAVVTNDNPRSEDPRAIADAVLAGMRGPGARTSVELDRRAAIARAVLDAEPGACVLVAGKGHEDYQIVGGVTLPFDDRDEGRLALEARRARAGGAS